MSRCFPYPPPGYLGIEGSGLALIESIKLRERDLVNAKAKKDRKREKKERKKQEKDKTIATLEPSTDVLQTKNVQVERSIGGLKGGPVSKLLQSENEQLERSSLTEEHALHPCEEKPSTSSDSTQNSSKRKRDASSSSAAVVKQEENSIRGSGNVIRIRLSSKKQNALVSRQDPCSIAPTSEQTELPSQKHNDVISSRQEPCSTSGRPQLAACDRYQDGHVVVPSIGLGNSNLISVCPPRPEAPRPEAPRPEADLACSSLVPRLVTREGNAAAAVCQYPENKLRAPPRRPERESGSASAELKEINREDDIVVRDPKTLNKKLVKAELRYRDLFSNWVPPPPQAEMELEDLDWLFDKKKNPDNQSEKKLKPSNNVPCSSSSSLWPRAQFIPVADIYALPYTVPF